MRLPRGKCMVLNTQKNDKYVERKLQKNGKYVERKLELNQT